MVLSRSTHINDPPLVIKSSLTYCPNFWDHLFPLNPATPTYKVETFFGMFDLIVHSACTQPTETLCDQIHHFIFDHEVAHALGAQFDRNGDLSTQHLDESIADAYAALRHVQRYGENTGIIDMVRDCRITGALMGDLEHYSSPALDAAASWLCENDVTQMPPAALMVAATEISQNVCTSLNIHALVEEAKIEGLSIVDFINNFDLINLCIEDTGKKTQHKEVFDLCQNWFKAIKAYGLTDKNKCLEEKSRPWILSASKEAPGHKNAPRQPRQKALSL